MGGQHGQAVGVDENGQIGPEHRAQQLGGIVAGAHAGTGYPGLHPADGSEKVLRGRVRPAVAAAGRLGWQRGDHGLRPPLPHDLDRLRGGHEPHHPCAAADGAADRQHGRAGEPLAARHDADDAPAVLIRIGGGRGKQRGDVRGLRGGEGGRAEMRPQADVDQLGHAGVGRAGIDEQARLPGAEGDGDVGADGGPIDRSGVGVDAARQVHRDHRRGRAGGQGGQAGVRLPQAPLAPDAEHPVDDEAGPADRTFGRRVRARHDPAAGCAQRGRAALMRPRPGRDRQHRRAPPGQVRRGVERVTAVVTAAGQHDDPCPVDPAEERGADRREPGRRALHEGTGGQLRHQFGFGRADRGDLVSFPHEVTVLARGGDPPGTPRCAARPGGDPPEPPAAPARGATPRNPPHALRAPRWYFADTPATHRARGPVRWAGNDRLVVGRVRVLADRTGRSLGPSAPARWPVTSASP